MINKDNYQLKCINNAKSKTDNIINFFSNFIKNLEIWVRKLKSPLRRNPFSLGLVSQSLYLP